MKVQVSSAANHVHYIFTLTQRSLRMPSNSTDTVSVPCRCPIRPIQRRGGHNIPRKVHIGLQEGTSHSFILPAQLPVARILLFGENLTCEIGRSSPIWDPSSAKFCPIEKWSYRCFLRRQMQYTHLHFRKDLLPYIDNSSKRHFAVYSLLSDAFLSSIWRIQK
jgi:hypothetical protein